MYNTLIIFFVEQYTINCYKAWGTMYICINIELDELAIQLILPTFYLTLSQLFNDILCIDCLLTLHCIK